MKRIILISFLVFLANSIMAQSQLSGKILDKADKKPLTNATIVLLNQDSILKYFARANEDGKFVLPKINPADYHVIISYPKFELYSKKIKITNSNLTLEDIELSSQANLLEEIVIKQKLPITIKGDTIEYDAASFQTEKNAKLEDLLRRLPGLTVSGDGAITAHGKSVSKVLIDGEEFFGYDPKIAIRNIRADAVDKVQVYERKSDESEKTGIDDGVRIQTVNVVLKEEARVGIFGNVEGNLGTEDLYTANLFAAKFNRTERIGITANTNNMGGNSGGRESNLRNNSLIRGNPQNSSIGANYENQFFKKTTRLNANYNFTNGSDRNESYSYNKEIISPTEIQETERTSKNSSTNQGHNFRSEIRARLDSTSNLDVQINGSKTNNTGKSKSDSYMQDGNGIKIRDFEDENESFSNNQSNEIRLNYRKQLNKKGASINAHINNNYNESYQENRVVQQTYFYKNDSTVNVNQNRVTESDRNNISAQLQFNNRFKEKINYSIGYNISNNTSKNKLDAYDLNAGTTIVDLNYSQNQKTNNTNQGIVTNINYIDPKWNVNFSNRTNYRDQTLTDTYRDIDLSRDFWDNDFNIRANYKISNRKNLNFSYQNNFDVPSFGQLQPLQPQNNPIFIQEGNPDLKKAINSNLSANFNSMSLLKGTSWNINTNFNIKSNPIVNKRTIDENSVTTSTYVNVEGKSSWNGNINTNYNKPIFDKTVQMNIFSGFGYNNGFSYIRYNENNTIKNSQFELNNSQNANLSTGIGINEQDSKYLDYDFSWRVSANNQRNSLQKNLNNTSFNTGGNALLKYFLPKQFNISANVVYSLEGKTKLYNKNIHQFYTNIEISKKLLKSESLVASIKAFDVFNSYNNINRNISETNFSESTQLILTRYVLFGLKWDFNKNLGKKKDE